jgi:zinc transport system substrate-binding protein
MRIVLVPALLLVSFAAAGCAGGSGASGDGRTEVVAAFFPLAEAARLSGADVDVTDLTPPGAEPHELELTTDQVDRILDADVVIVLGGGFQPAVADVASDRDGPTVDVLDELGLDTDDPHVWLDPMTMARIAEVVAGALGGDATDFVAQLQRLDDRYERVLATCESDVVGSAHDAFGHLVDRYGLRQESVSGLVPETEPDPARLDELARLVEREGVTTVFTEPLLPKRVADTLARETGADIATLDPLETDPGTTYIEAMDANLDRLTKGLRGVGS